LRIQFVAHHELIADQLELVDDQPGGPYPDLPASALRFHAGLSTQENPRLQSSAALSN
jgi:hypothetical protein